MLAGTSRRVSLVLAIALATVSVAAGPANAVGANSNGAATYGRNLGVNITITDAFDSDLDALARTNARWVRVDAFWVGVQRDGKTSWEWAHLDDEVQAAESRGLNVLLVPTYAPVWAALPGCKSARCGPVHPADYARFVSAAAQRYSPGGVFGSHVRAWEIWNEPNGPGFGPDPDPVKYTTMLKLAAVAIRAVNPTAQILTGGVAPAPDLPDGQSYAPATFLTAIYRNGGHGSFTAVANHPYSGNYAPMFRAEWNAFYTTPKLHRIMARYGDGNRKIWGTEFGYASSLVFGVGEAMQAALLGIGIVIWHRWSFTGPLFVFNLRDQSAIDVGKFDTTGMLHYDGSRKPAWRMFKFLARAYPA